MAIHHPKYKVKDYWNFYQMDILWVVLIF